MMTHPADLLDGNAKLTCNICQRVVEGIAFRTTCRHYFCPACCQQGGGCRCPICSIALNAHDMREFVVGMEPPLFPLDSVFQSILHSPNWMSILDSQKQFALGLIEFNEFINTQLALISRRDESLLGQLQGENFQVKNERVGALRGTPNFGSPIVLFRQDSIKDTLAKFEAFAEEQIGILRSQVVGLEKELSEMGEAYREKMRKCSAWEKVPSDNCSARLA
jgi:hypothetical protein